MKISKTFTFDAAHHLPNYNGKCARIHGHEFQFEVVLSGDPNPRTGMIIDFEIFKQIVQSNILDKLDHTDLNNILEIPTAEKIAKYIFVNLKDVFNSVPIKLVEVSVWEQPTSKVTFS